MAGGARLGSGPGRSGAPQLPVARLRVEPAIGVDIDGRRLGRCSRARRVRRRGPTPAPPPNAEPATVRPRTFNQAQELADRFKEGNSVILNLESADRDTTRRLVDFASGVCYALDGTMEKVASGVYLLKPAPARVHRFDDYES